MTLFKQHLKAELVSLLVWCLALFATMFFITLLWQSYRTSGNMQQLEALVQSLPDSFRAMFGAQLGFTTLPGWLEIFAYSGVLTALPIIYVAMFAAGAISREMDRRTMEFVLSLPVSRLQVLLSRWSSMAVALAVLQLAHLAGVLVAVVAIGEPTDLSRWSLVELNAWLLMLAMGSVLLIISILVDDYGVSVGAILGTGLAFFFVHVSTESATGVLKSIRDLLPMAFYNPSPILRNGTVPWADLGVLAGATLVALGLSIYLFQRKQIAV